MMETSTWLNQQVNTARTLVDRGSQALRQNDLDTADSILSEASAILDMAEDETDDVLMLRAQILNERGFLLQRTDRGEEAGKLHQSAVDLCNTLMERGVEFRGNAAATHINLAGVLASKGDLVEARRVNTRAVELVESLLEEEPDSPQARNLQFGARSNLAVVEARSSDMAGAEASMQKALESVDPLAEAGHKAIHAQAAQACQQLSVLMFQADDFDRALTWGIKAEAFSEKAYENLGDQALPIYVTSQINLISYHEKKGQFADGEDCLWKALDVVGNHPQILERGKAFYENCRKQADARLEQGNLPREEVEQGLSELLERIEAMGGLPSA